MANIAALSGKTLQDEMMKLFLFWFFLGLVPCSFAGTSEQDGYITIRGIALEKAESIAVVLDGINRLRGGQNVIWEIGEGTSLEIIDMNEFPACPVVVFFDEEGIRFGTEERVSKDELSEQMKLLVQAGKSSGHGGAVVGVYFSESISGERGYEVLLDLVDCGVVGLLFSRVETIAEK